MHRVLHAHVRRRRLELQAALGLQRVQVHDLDLAAAQRHQDRELAHRHDAVDRLRAQHALALELAPEGRLASSVLALGDGVLEDGAVVRANVHAPAARVERLDLARYIAQERHQLEHTNRDLVTHD